MAVPRVLFVVPLLVAGIVIPAAGAAPARAPSGTVGMVHEAFATDSVTVQCGHTLTFVNSSRFVHIIGAGRDGTLAEAAGVPLTGRRLMETDDRYVTGRWSKPGTYYLTCSVHPEMNLKVVVTVGCCC